MKRLKFALLTIFLCLVLTVPAYAKTANENAIGLLEQAILLLREPVPLPPPDPPPVGPKRHTIMPPEFTGNEKDTRITKHNPQFKIIGDFFGYYPGSSKRYVYNTKYRNSGRGHVEYHPGLTGRYEAKFFYRATRNRSKRPPDVRHMRDGRDADTNFVFKKIVAEFRGPVQYSEKSGHRSAKFVFDLQAGDYIAIVPADPKSIAFGRMEFTRMED